MSDESMESITYQTCLNFSRSTVMSDEVEEKVGDETNNDYSNYYSNEQ
jgi:hypothetical protein